MARSVFPPASGLPPLACRCAYCHAGTKKFVRRRLRGRDGSRRTGQKNASTAWKAATHGDDFGACRKNWGVSRERHPRPWRQLRGSCPTPDRLTLRSRKGKLSSLAILQRAARRSSFATYHGLIRRFGAAALTWGFAIRAKNQPTRCIAVDTHDHHSGRSARGYYRETSGLVSSVSFLPLGILFGGVFLPRRTQRTRREEVESYILGVL